VVENVTDMRKIDVWWGVGNKRTSQIVSTIAIGKKLMRQKRKAGEESIVMYVAHETEDDNTITYFFKDGKIKSEKL